MTLNNYYLYHFLDFKLHKKQNIEFYSILILPANSIFLKLSNLAKDAAPCKVLETYLSHLHVFNFDHHFSSSSSIKIKKNLLKRTKHFD